MRAKGILLLLMIAAGCSRAPEAPYDSARAQSTLAAALDAWKKGEVGSLAKRQPPIRFVDEDLAAGLRLSDYEIEEPDAPIGLHENVAVILSLRDSRGKVVRRETQYQVAIEPGLAVLRSGH
jgi:hypothetical protein